MESRTLHFLYRTVLGRAILKFLTWPLLSKAVGVFLDSKYSTFLIPKFIAKNNINTDEVIEPEGGFSCFNQFFCRRVKREAFTFSKGELISPCDAFLTSIPIKNNCILDVKHTKFTIEDLLHDPELAKEYKGGYALVFRLTPAHYHRYCFASDGVITKRRRIKGILHTVRPIATSTVPVFAQNAREYQVVKTNDFGKLVQMEVGAMFVGRINNHDKYSCGSKVKAGAEKGFFEFGGSTIIVLLKKGMVELEAKYDESSVKQGQVIARSLFSC